MEAYEFEIMKESQDKHWWWRGRGELIRRLIESHIRPSRALSIADVGCGFGSNISLLNRFGNVTALETNSEAIRHVQHVWEGSVRCLAWEFPERIHQRFDLILLADVLEHIHDDALMIDWVHEHLNDGGHAWVTVPAHRYLWTQMDDVVHHYRRYSKQDLLPLFEKKFEVVKFSYYNMFLFPVKLAFVLFDRLNRAFWPGTAKRSYTEMPPALINALFKHVMSLEAKMIERAALPFGVSIILVVRKKQRARL